MQYYQLSLEILSKNLELKALYLWMNQDLKIIKIVFMPGQKKGKKFMVSKRENEVKEKIQQPGEEKKSKDLIAPIIFQVTLNALGFEQWLFQHLLPSLKIPSVLISDNSPTHRKNVIRELVEAGGHQLLFLPKYSPD